MIRFRAFDLGGHTMARKVWDDYSQSADAVVFIIDACDRARFQEAKVRAQPNLISRKCIGSAFTPDDNASACVSARVCRLQVELDGMMALPNLAAVPVIVLLNKIDIPQAASEAEMRAVLNIHGEPPTHPSSPAAEQAFVRPGLSLIRMLDGCCVRGEQSVRASVRLSCSHARSSSRWATRRPSGGSASTSNRPIARQPALSG